MSIAIKSIVAASMLAVAMPAAAQTADRDTARVAILRARAKLAAGDRAGVNGSAADAQARARAALYEAQEQFRKNHDVRARAAAERAITLADLALATAQSRQAEAERRAAITSPQE